MLGNIKETMQFFSTDCRQCSKVRYGLYLVDRGTCACCWLDLVSSACSFLFQHHQAELWTISYTMPTCLFTYLPIYLTTYLPLYLPTHLPTSLPTCYLPTNLPIYLPTCLFTYLIFTYQFTYLSTIYLPIYLSTCLPTYLPRYLPELELLRTGRLTN